MFAAGSSEAERSPSPFSSRKTLPVIAPGVISGALFAFMTSFDEVIIALFIASPAQFTLPRQLFSGLREQLDPSIIAISTLVIVFTVGLLAAYEVLRSRAARNQILR